MKERESPQYVALILPLPSGYGLSHSRSLQVEVSGTTDDVVSPHLTHSTSLKLGWNMKISFVALVAGRYVRFWHISPENSFQAIHQLNQDHTKKWLNINYYDRIGQYLKREFDPDSSTVHKKLKAGQRLLLLSVSILCLYICILCSWHIHKVQIFVRRK